MSEMKIKLFSYKDKEHIFEVTKKTKIKEIKEKLKDKLNSNIKDIKLLFSSQLLEDHQTLDHYKIENGNTIFYYNKKSKQKKGVKNIGDNNNKPPEDKEKGNEMENKIEKEEEKERIEPKTEKVELESEILKLLNLYSTLIKILTYNKEENMDLILNNLKTKYTEDFNKILANKNKFFEQFKKPITQEDIKVYEENYMIAQNLNETSNNTEEKFDIRITDTERQYFNYWENKGMAKDDIILEYVNNKFDVKKTNENLFKLSLQK